MPLADWFLSHEERDNPSSRVDAILDDGDASWTPGNHVRPIVHGADYCDPSYLRRFGKLGRSNGCFSVSNEDLATLRPAMASGRLIFAAH